jgi:hypothetical protein
LDWTPALSNISYSSENSELSLSFYFRHTHPYSSSQRAIWLFFLDDQGDELTSQRICIAETNGKIRGSCTHPISSVPIGTKTLRVRAIGCPQNDPQTIEHSIPYAFDDTYDDDAGGGGGGGGTDHEPSSCGTNATEGQPVRLTNGNMRYTERLPLPGMIANDRMLVFDTRNQVRGVFGVGWWSLFDARLTTQQIGGDLHYRVVTETNHTVKFVGPAAGGPIVQTWPATGLPGSLESNWEHGRELLVYSTPDGDLERFFDPNDDGRMVRLALPAEARALWVSYDANGPASVAEESGAWARSITTSQDGLIETISSGNASWTFGYVDTAIPTGIPNNPNEPEELRLGAVSVNGSPWRTYEYDLQGRMVAALDGVGDYLETHTYDPVTGYATGSRTASENIVDIQYYLPSSTIGGRLPKPEFDEYLARVEWASGRVAEYYIRPVRSPQGDVAPHRVYEVNGDCGCGDGNEYTVFARDELGRLVRRQDARGYVTQWIYGFGVDNRITEVRRGRFPEGCDPAVNDPAQCRLDPEELLSAVLAVHPA